MAKQTYLTLPNNLKMPAVGLGTWEATDEAELVSALNTALEYGYRHIDTAYAYGNEAIIGKVLKEWFKSGKIKREDLFITTKLPIYGVHPDRVEFFIKKSLENLQVDYLDLYLIHFPVGFKYDINDPKPDLSKLEMEPKTDHAAVWKKMEEQVDKGRTKSIGLSNYDLNQIETVLKSARIKPANVQTELHVYMQQRELVDLCHKNGVTVVAYSPLGSPGYNKFLNKFGKQKELPNILGDPVVSKIATKHKKTPAQVVLRFLLQEGISIIPKSVTAKRIKENFDVFDFQLDSGDIQDLRKLEIGEDARVLDFTLLKGVENHPDYPIPITKKK